MKIGVIIPQKKLFGGGPRLALEMCQELKKAGHQPILYTFQYKPDEKQYLELTRGLTIHSLPEDTRTKPKPFFGISFPGSSTLAVFRHEHQLAKKLAGIMDKDLDALNPHGNRQAYLVAYYYKKIHQRNIRVVWQMNDLHLFAYTRCMPKPDGTPGTCSFPAWTLYRFLDAIDSIFFLPTVDQISVLSSEVKKQAEKHLSLPINVIRSGVQAAYFPYKKRLALTGRKIRLLAHAQFFRHRRFEDAVQAVKILLDRGWDPELVISGDSETYRAYREYREELRTLSAKLGITERVSFPGRISDKALIDTFHTADIFIFPHVLQSWGLVVFEAMATGLPVVISREAGAHEVLSHEENALFVDARKPEEIANAVERLAQDGELYLKLSSNAHSFVTKSLTWKQFAEKIVELLR